MRERKTDKNIIVQKVTPFNQSFDSFVFVGNSKTMPNFKNSSIKTIPNIQNILFFKIIYTTPFKRNKRDIISIF